MALIKCQKATVAVCNQKSLCAYCFSKNCPNRRNSSSLPVFPRSAATHLHAPIKYITCLQVLQIDRFIIIRFEVLMPIMSFKLLFMLRVIILVMPLKCSVCFIFISLGEIFIALETCIYLRLLFMVYLLSVSEWCFHYLHLFSSLGFLPLFISNFYRIHFRCFLIYLKTKATFIFI